MTHPIDLPDTFHDHRNDEYHGGGIAGIAVGLAFLAVIAWAVLA